MPLSDYDILIPQSGDFTAWPQTSHAAIAVDWDGTCKDTMTPKWTKGFNWAATRIWPALKPFQKQIDQVCYQVNMVDPTAGVQRFVALKIMMGKWKAMGLPVPDLAGFCAAVETVEKNGEKHGVETYRKYQQQFGYDDSPMRWSDLSDEIIAESARDAVVFEHCRESLEAVVGQADLIVVSASKTEAVRQDLIHDRMAHLFKALCAQDFLPKKGTLQGLARRYERTLFIGDTNQDVQAAKAARVPLFLVKVGDEAASWAQGPEILRRFLAGEKAIAGVIYP